MTAGLGVFSNIATDLKSSVWAWPGVVVLVLAGAAVGFELEKRSRSGSPADSQTPPASKAAAQTNSGQQGVQASVGGSSERITVKSRSGAAGLTVGVLVIVATLSVSLV